MTRDPKKLKEYRKRYKEKLKKLGVTRLGTFITKKCHKCELEFSDKSKIHMVKGLVRKYYHQKCWDGMKY